MLVGLFIVNVGLGFKMFWSIVKGFLDFNIVVKIYVIISFRFLFCVFFLGLLRLIGVWIVWCIDNFILNIEVICVGRLLVLIIKRNFLRLLMKGEFFYLFVVFFEINW